MASPSVVPRSEIPASMASADAQLDVRQFRAHALLGKMMPGAAVSVSWTHVRQDQERARPRRAGGRSRPTGRAG